MEEDIKVLERLVDEKELTGIYKTDEIVLQAIENLIKGYKNLEEELERRIEQKVMDYRYVDKNMLRKDIIQRDYIPKSKVREKKEELKDFDSDGNDYDYIYKKGQYELCEELLQEGDDK